MAKRPGTGEDEYSPPPGIDITAAHAARVYDYWLGGKDNFEADRIAAEEVITVRPTIVRDVRANRAFLGRVVRFLARDAGIRQFLDIGTGIPAAGNTHEVAQSVDPECRIVYVDNDPIVLAHARALLSSSPGGACAYLDADLKETARILQEAARTLDFSRPVVTEMVRATVPGSYLALTQPAKDINAEMVAEGARRYNERVKVPQTRRSYAETRRFFDGMRFVPPVLVQCHRSVRARLPPPGKCQLTTATAERRPGCTFMRWPSRRERPVLPLRACRHLLSLPRSRSG
jgi:S-adenosyl methyltransferase